jgi:hypothetical protein
MNSDELMKICEDKEKAWLRLIEVAYSDDTFSSLFRTAVDSWFAYHRTISACGNPSVLKDCTADDLLTVRGNVNPRWFNTGDLTKKKNRQRGLRSFHAVSKKAQTVIDEQDNKPLIKEHVVPLVVLKKLLTVLGPKGPIAVGGVLEHCYRVALLTKEEAKQLDGKYKSEMPKERWPQVAGRLKLNGQTLEGCPSEDELFMRYSAVGIEFTPL